MTRLTPSGHRDRTCPRERSLPFGTIARRVDVSRRWLDPLEVHHIPLDEVRNPIHRRPTPARGHLHRLTRPAKSGARACVAWSCHFHAPVRLRHRPQPRWRGKACEQHRQNAGQEYAVKCPCATDGGDRRAKVADLVQIENIGAD